MSWKVVMTPALAQETGSLNSVTADAQHATALDLLDSFPANRVADADWNRVCRDLFTRYNDAANPRWSVCSSRIDVYEKMPANTSSSHDGESSLIHTSHAGLVSWAWAGGCRRRRRGRGRGRGRVCRSKTGKSHCKPPKITDTSQPWPKTLSVNPDRT